MCFSCIPLSIVHVWGIVFLASGRSGDFQASRLRASSGHPACPADLIGVFFYTSGLCDEPDLFCFFHSESSSCTKLSECSLSSPCILWSNTPPGIAQLFLVR